MTVDATSFKSNYGVGCGQDMGADGVYTISVPAGRTLQVTLTPIDNIIPAIGIALGCTDIENDVCMVRGAGGGPQTIMTSWVNDTGSAQTAYIVADVSQAGNLTLLAEVLNPSCGDGSIEGTEVCDDGNSTGGDGCSSTCTVEAGYNCGAEPSVCGLPPSNDLCSAPVVLTSGVTVSAHNGPASDDYGRFCGYSGGGGDLVYSIDVPALSVASLRVTPTDGQLDASIAWATSCAEVMSNDCLGKADAVQNPGGVESGQYTNTSNSTETLYIVVDGWKSHGAFDVRAEILSPGCGNGVLETNEQCDDGNTSSGDGCANGCAQETGWFCSGEPSVCQTTVNNDVCSGAFALTSGITITGNNIAANNDYDSNCGSGTSGADLVYSIGVGAGQTLTVNVVPSGQQDPTIGFAFSCTEVMSNQCLPKADNGLDGDSETLTYLNDTGAMQTIFIVMDTYSNLGAMDITATVN
jgi:cysteine-rich repeat protein